MADLDRILNRLEPDLQKALIDALEGMRSDIDVRALRAAVDAYDIEAIVDILTEDDGSYFIPYILTATTIYLTYGRAYAPTFQRGMRFNPPQTGSPPIVMENVNRMTDANREVVRSMVMEEMSRAGANRQDTARIIAKRAREIIGLSPAQKVWVDTMRERLLSGDPDQIRDVIRNNSLRDRRYDRTIKKAIDGEPISPAQVDKIVNAYAERLRRDRARKVAEAEVVQFAEAAKYDAVKQSGANVQKTWRHSAMLKHARKDHIFMNGKKVIGLETPFVLPDGTRMQYPHDPVGGAKHNANCRCRATYKKLKG